MDGMIDQGHEKKRMILGNGLGSGLPIEDKEKGETYT